MRARPVCQVRSKGNALCSARPSAQGAVSSRQFFGNTTWGRPGFDSGYVVRASMQSGGERLFKTISKP